MDVPLLGTVSSTESSVREFPLLSRHLRADITHADVWGKPLDCFVHAIPLGSPQHEILESGGPPVHELADLRLSAMQAGS